MTGGWMSLSGCIIPKPSIKKNFMSRVEVKEWSPFSSRWIGLTRQRQTRSRHTENFPVLASVQREIPSLRSACRWTDLANCTCAQLARAIFLALPASLELDQE